MPHRGADGFGVHALLQGQATERLPGCRLEPRVGQIDPFECELRGDAEDVERVEPFLRRRFQKPPRFFAAQGSYRGRVHPRGFTSLQTLCPINRHLTAQLRAEESTPWMRRTLAADNARRASRSTSSLPARTSGSQVSCCRRRGPGEASRCPDRFPGSDVSRCPLSRPRTGPGIRTP
jgi:hypothetical protein